MAGVDTVRNGRKARLPSNDSGLYEAIQRFWQTSYAGDYLGFILLLAAYLVIQFTGQPFHRLFRLDDPRIGFPHAEVERVPVSTSLIYFLMCSSIRDRGQEC